MAKEVITAMVIGVKDFTSNLSLIAIIGLGTFLILLMGVMIFLGYKLKKIKREKLEAIERKKHESIVRHHEEEQKKIIEIRKSKARSLMLERKKYDIRDEGFEWEKMDDEQTELFGKAMAVVHDARRGGFSELEIRNMFLERGWREQDIQKLLNE